MLTGTGMASLEPELVTLDRVRGLSLRSYRCSCRSWSSISSWNDAMNRKCTFSGNSHLCTHLKSSPHFFAEPFIRLEMLSRAIRDRRVLPPIYAINWSYKLYDCLKCKSFEIDSRTKLAEDRGKFSRQNTDMSRLVFPSLISTKSPAGGWICELDSVRDPWHTFQGGREELLLDPCSG